MFICGELSKLFCCGTWIASHLFHYMDGTGFVFFQMITFSKIYSTSSRPRRKQRSLLASRIKKNTAKAGGILFGCGTWTRTKINGSKTRCPTIRRSRNNSHIIHQKREKESGFIRNIFSGEN